MNISNEELPITEELHNINLSVKTYVLPSTEIMNKLAYIVGYIIDDGINVDEVMKLVTYLNESKDTNNAIKLCLQVCDILSKQHIESLKI